MTSQLPRLEVEEIGKVTVVRFVDRKLLDEANIKQMGEELFGLVVKANRRKLVLAFASVEFLSSAAVGQLFTLDRLSRKAGARLALCQIHPEIYQVFAITRSNRLFQIYDTLDEALASMEGELSDQFLISCPIHECGGHARATTALALKEVRSLSCPNCAARFTLVLPDISPGGECLTITASVQVPTYARELSENWREYMELSSGCPFSLKIVGRLDLFTSAVLEKLWLSVPLPRHLVIDCTHASDCSQRGVDVLARLVSDGDARAVALVNKSSLPASFIFPATIPVVTDRDQAVHTLDNGADEPRSLMVKVTRPTDENSSAAS